METRKRRFGDRKDGYWLRDLDPMHAFMPYLYKNRADNEAFIQEQVDITNILEYLDKKNEGQTEQKYTLFHAVLAALGKTVTLRPKMNRFVKGYRTYQRNKLTIAFVVKKQFTDESHEALAFLEHKPEDTLISIHGKIMTEITDFREEKRVDTSTAGMDFLSKFPRFLLRFLVAILHKMDFYGTVPDALGETDPNCASIFVSNLGSIKLNAAYHHLSNWGTCSLFVVMGEIHKAPFFDDEGNVTMRTVVDFGITLDERIADGYYYAKTVHLFKHLIENPDLLDLPANTEVAS